MSNPSYRILKHFGESYFPVGHAAATIYKNNGEEDRQTVALALDSIEGTLGSINSTLTNIYNKDETDNLFNLLGNQILAINQFDYISVSSLPEASEGTMKKIYLVSSSNPETQNFKDEFITLKSKNSLFIDASNVNVYYLDSSESDPSNPAVGDIVIYTDSYSATNVVPNYKIYEEIYGGSSWLPKTAEVGTVIVVNDAEYYKFKNVAQDYFAWLTESGTPEKQPYIYSWEQIGSTAIDVSNKINTVTGANNYIPKFNSNGQLESSGVISNDISDAVSKKHSHSNITLSTDALAYDGNHTIQLPANDPYSSSRTPSSHTHGNISNSGTLTDTDSTPSVNDHLVMKDYYGSIKSSDINALATKEAVRNRPFYITSEQIEGGLTFSEIFDAYDSDRLLIFISNQHGGISRDVYVPLTVTNADTDLNEQRYFIFGGAYTNKDGRDSEDYTESGVIMFELWEGDNDSIVFNLHTDSLETTINKVLSISSSSTQYEYPSAKAVYDYINGTSASTEDIYSIFL